ncbi:unnamed protein product [Haemonchus placei]|uniref:Pecanex-like protein n=1 Tax=Haemonchus placei TaxID=6290 RepID=A0A0N4X4F9_HAEPC|nr:unnamed protein product [Haemonchus placei]
MANRRGILEEQKTRSLKALVMRSESDFSRCIATEAHNIEDAERPKEGLCSERLSIPLRPSCAELRSFSTSRCEALKKCCTVTEKCEKQQHTTSISSMLVAQKSTVSMLLRGCLSNLAGSSLSNETRKSDSNTMRAVTSALDLMQGLEELSDKTSHDKSIPAHERIQSKSTAVERRDSNNVTEASSSPITSQVKAAIWQSKFKSDYRRKPSSKSERYPARMFAAPRYTRRREISVVRPFTDSFDPHAPILTIDEETSRVDGTAEMLRIQRLQELMKEGNTRSGHSRGHVAPIVTPPPPPSASSPLVVDLVIDRTLQNPFFPPPIPPIPQREYSVNAYREYSPAQTTTSPPPATPFFPSTTIYPIPDTSTVTPLYLFRKPFRQSPIVDSEHSLRIRRPWSNRFKLVKRGKSTWKGTSKRKQKYYNIGRTSGKRERGPIRSKIVGDVTNAIRPSHTFRDEFAIYPKDTEVLTDIAIPYRNRLQHKLRVTPLSRSPVEGDGSVMTDRSAHVLRPEKKKTYLSTEDAIYEDVLQQEQKLLSQRNAQLSTDDIADFDDNGIPSSQPQEFQLIPPPFVVFKQRKVTALTKPKTNLGLTSERFYRIRKPNKETNKNKVLFTTDVSAKPKFTQATTTSESVPSTTTTGNTPEETKDPDNPLEGAIVEEPLTVGEDERHVIPTITLSEFEEQHLEPLGISNETITFRPDPTTPSAVNVSGPVTEISNQSSQASSTHDLPSDITDPLTYKGPSFYYEKNLGNDTDQKTSSENDTYQKRMTIIPTMKNPYWTLDPPASSFQVEVIPFPKNNPVDGPMVAVDQIATVTISTTEQPDTTATFPTLMESSSDFIGPLPQMKRRRMQAAKTYSSVLEPSADPDNSSTAGNDSADAVSVLQISETISQVTGGLPIHPNNLPRAILASLAYKITLAVFYSLLSRLCLHTVHKLNELGKRDVQILKLSHCEVYSLCLDELSREEKACGTKASRILLEDQRKRRSSCKEKLVPDYQAVDDETRSLAEIYGACIKNRLGQNITEVEPSQCDAYSLPSNLENEPCRSRVHVLKQHCSRLSKCCPDAKACRHEVDSSERGRYLRRRKESLAVAATKCRILRYRRILKRVSLLGNNPVQPS